MTFPRFIDRRSFTIGLGALGGAFFLGCSSSDASGAGAAPLTREATKLPKLAGVKLTTERTLVPSHVVLASTDPRSPLDPTDRAALLADGFGDYTWGPGEPLIGRMQDGSAPPSPGPSPKMLVRFAHVTDIHVADDESPIRLELFDSPPPLDAGARPQAPYMGRVLNAAVRTLNAVHAQSPLDFVLVGGDVVDSAQQNELSWFLGTMTGGVAAVTCDSGDVNDPTPGPNDDPKDPYAPEGIAVPWLFCMGNHDALIMGINKITPANQAIAQGDNCTNGFTDWSQPGGVVRSGLGTPDASRKPLMRADMFPLIAADGDGHGVAASSIQVAGRSCYTHDVAQTNLRFIVHDTAAEGGSSDGVVRKSVVDSYLKPALDAALAAGKWVVLASHHPVGSLGDGSSSDAETEADAMAPADFLALLAGYPNIVLSVTGHTHENLVSYLGTPAAGFWEFQTSSLVEFPNQMRLVEIADEDNGFLSVKLVGVDFATDDDPVAEEGRKLAVLDHTSGWGGGAVGTAQDRNVILYVKKPAG